MPARARTPRRARRPQDGFTLLEVLVAFTVAAIGIVALMQAFTGGLRSLGRMDELAVGAMVAESRLAEVGILYPVAAGEMEGREEGGKYRWRVSIEPFADPEGLAGSSDMGPVLYLVQVDVSWPGRRRPGHFRLHSLRVGQ